MRRCICSGPRVYDESLAQTITRSEEDIDRCNEAFRNNHIKRLTKRKCTPEQGAVFWIC